MNIEQVKELMSCLEKSSLSKMVFKKGDFELTLEKEGAFIPAPQRIPSAVAHVPETVHPPKKTEEPVGVFVTSPMVGTYYASPAPDQAHFVKVGDKVHEGTIVCIIEAMKVMNEVKAGKSGTIAEIIVHNGHPVEFGTRLFRIV